MSHPENANSLVGPLFKYLLQSCKIISAFRLWHCYMFKNTPGERPGELPSTTLSKICRWRLFGMTIPTFTCPCVKHGTLPEIVPSCIYIYMVNYCKLIVNGQTYHIIYICYILVKHCVFPLLFNTLYSQGRQPCMTPPACSSFFQHALHPTRRPTSLRATSWD